MQLQDELQRILDNLLFKGEDGNFLVDLNMDEKKERMESIIPKINEKTDKEVEIITEKELCKYECVLRDEINTVKCIYEMTLERDELMEEKITMQQRSIDMHYLLRNFFDASNKFDKMCGGLFKKYYIELVKIHQKTIIEQNILTEGNILGLNLNSAEMAMILQLDYLIRYYELEGIRKELINIVKCIMIKLEMREMELGDKRTAEM